MPTQKVLPGDKLDSYWGEFLTSPIPLEMSLNYCSMKCAYCFANLNNPNRTADTKAIMSLLANYKQRSTVAAMLLQHDYPSLISNRVDPFAVSNYKVALPIMETMRQLNLEIGIQTKGGNGIDEALDFMQPSVWYVSIAFDDDKLREKLEPGAPTIDSRYEMVEKVIAKGHKVVVGVNPLVPEWLPDPRPALERCKAVGVHGVWIESLHLNRKQAGNLSAKEREAMTEELINKSFKRKLDPQVFGSIMSARDIALEVGLEIFTMGQPTASKFFQPWTDLYRRVFPTTQDWINHLYQTKKDGDPVSFAEFLEFFAPKLPSGVHCIDSYLGATAHNMWNTIKIPPRMTYAHLLSIIWRYKQCNKCPANLPAFAFASSHGEPVVDKNNFPVLAFIPNLQSSWWFDIGDSAVVKELDDIQRVE